MSGGWLRVALACLVMFAGRLAAADGEPSIGQKQALYAKPSVVRVVGVYEVSFQVAGREMKQYLGGTGSGFFVSGDGFIATNAHVVKVIKEGEQAARDGALQQLLRELDRDYATELARMSRAELVTLVDEIKKTAKATPTAQVILPDGTKLDYVIKAYGAPIGQGKDVSIIKVDTQNAPNLTVGDSDFVTVQDHLIAIGYPGAADMTGLLDTKSLLEASITEGSVSAIKRTTDGEPVLQVQVPITHGNSGGPAINDKGEVVGLTTFGSKDEVQGFNFLVASSTVMKFVKEAKADNSPSKTNVLWRKALGEMWTGDLDPAIADFEEVMTLFPPHSEAPRIVKQARALKRDGKGKGGSKDDSTATSGGNAAGIVVGILLGLAVIVTIVVLVVRSKNKGPQAIYPVPPQPFQGTFPPPPPQGQLGMQPPMQPPQQQPMMMGGRVQPSPSGQVAKTVAVSGASGSQPIAATAFGSLTVGSLTCTRGQLNGQRFGLTPQGLLIGRQPGLAQIVINDSRASGKHVWIGYENGTLVAIDQGTTNGTFVNDIRYGRISKAQLKEGDTVIVADPDCLSLTVKFGL